MGRHWVRFDLSDYEFRCDETRSVCGKGLKKRKVLMGGVGRGGAERGGDVICVDVSLNRGIMVGTD